MSKHTVNHELAERLHRELERLSAAGGKDMDEQRQFAAAAEAVGASFSTGTITRFGQNTSTAVMVYYKMDSGGTYGSPWPAWAYELARSALLHGRKIMVYANGDPTGANILYVYVTSAAA